MSGSKEIRKPLLHWANWVKRRRPALPVHIAPIHVWNIDLDVPYKRPTILSKHPAFGADRVIHLLTGDPITGKVSFVSKLGKLFVCHITDMIPATDEMVHLTVPKIGYIVFVEGFRDLLKIVFFDGTRIEFEGELYGIFLGVAVHLVNDTPYYKKRGRFVWISDQQLRL